MTKQEEKQRLRRTIRAMEAQLPDSYKAASSRAIAAHLLAMPEYRAADTVFCFVSSPQEIDTRPILEDALAAGKTLCVPRCVAPGVMTLHRISALAELAPGSYGILEPPEAASPVPVDAVDFAILPCLTCNHAGARLGKGGGYYDRFLSAYRGGVVLLCRERLIREEIPVTPRDYPVPWVLTEAGLFEDNVPARLG